MGVSIFLDLVEMEKALDSGWPSCHHGPSFPFSDWHKFYISLYLYIYTHTYIHSYMFISIHIHICMVLNILLIMSTPVKFLRNLLNLLLWLK